jgi:hypothetical protein
MSAPKGISLNDDLNLAKSPKISCTCAKLAKLNYDNANKIISGHSSAWRLHGFSQIKNILKTLLQILVQKHLPPILIELDFSWC